MTVQVVPARPVIEQIHAFLRSLPTAPFVIFKEQLLVSTAGEASYPATGGAAYLPQVAVSRHQEPWRTISELPVVAAPHTKAILPAALVTTSALTSMEALAEFAAVVLKELTAILRFCGDPDVGIIVQPDAPVVSVPAAYTSSTKPVEAFPVALI